MMSYEKMNRSEYNKIITDLKKSPLFHRLVVQAVEYKLAESRENYEDSSPASEFLRGQLYSFKTLLRDLTK